MQKNIIYRYKPKRSPTPYNFLNNRPLSVCNPQRMTHHEAQEQEYERFQQKLLGIDQSRQNVICFKRSNSISSRPTTRQSYQIAKQLDFSSTPFRPYSSRQIVKVPSCQQNLSATSSMRETSWNEFRNQQEKRIKNQFISSYNFANNKVKEIYVQQKQQQQQSLLQQQQQEEIEQEEDQQKDDQQINQENEDQQKQNPEVNEETPEQLQQQQNLEIDCPSKNQIENYLNSHELYKRHLQGLCACYSCTCGHCICQYGRNQRNRLQFQRFISEYERQFVKGKDDKNDPVKPREDAKGALPVGLEYQTVAKNDFQQAKKLVSDKGPESSYYKQAQLKGNFSLKEPMFYPISTYQKTFLNFGKNVSAQDHVKPNYQNHCVYAKMKEIPMLVTKTTYGQSYQNRVNQESQQPTQTKFLRQVNPMQQIQKLNIYQSDSRAIPFNSTSSYQDSFKKRKPRDNEPVSRFAQYQPLQKQLSFQGQFLTQKGKDYTNYSIKANNCPVKQYFTNLQENSKIKSD